VLDEAEAEQYGPWRNEVFPTLAPIQDAAEETMMGHWRGLVIMKAAQGGCSQAVKNMWGWCETFHPGPAGYLISKDDMAKKFGRMRFDPMIRNCQPLMRKALLQRGSGTRMQEKVFTDGYLSIFGGRSVLNLQSIPYRYMFIDEVDSLLDVLDDSDPIELARKRTNSYVGETLIVAFGHPSVKTRGAGRLYYKESDQRRGYVKCRQCDKEFWFSWEHLELHVPKGVTKEQAKANAENYYLACPHCKVEVLDSDRVMMLRNVKFKSELDKEEQLKRTWIGMHFNELYYPHKSIQSIVEDFLACGDDETKLRTFYNKDLGEPYETTLKQFSAEVWEKCVIHPTGPEDESGEAYRRGQIPEGVTLITAGQDSHKHLLYWSVWGWAKPVSRDGKRYLRGWLLDYGTYKRRLGPGGVGDLDMLTPQDLSIFDQLFFEKRFTTEKGSVLQIGMAGMDSGWQTTAVYQYCRNWPDRAVPVKGGAVRGLDYQNATKTFQWGKPVTYNWNGEMVRSRIRPAILNTFQLKLELFTYATKRLELFGRKEPVPVLAMPIDASEDLFKQLSSEKLLMELVRGQEVMVWKQQRANHWLDTAVYAYACALNQEPLLDMQPSAAGAGELGGHIPEDSDVDPLLTL